ncbi:MAG TPA: D-arabinono-1,4-lactone oxidase [Acidovorax sp.]|nr:D-arabinono-1,4-lactone oxidase [Acidovorax sp.]
MTMPAHHPTPATVTRRRAVATSASAVVAGLLAQPLMMGAASAQGASATNAPPAVASPPPWQNWSGVQRAQPSARPMPASEAELAALLKRSSGEVRVAGAGHSFTALVPTPGTLVSLDKLSGIVRIDKAAMTATVHAGTRLGTLARALDAEGLALPNLPDIDAQTLAGAIATGTHGTGAQLPAVHDGVVGARLVRSDGQVVELASPRDADALAAVRVSLGSLGVLSQLTLRVVPAFNLRRKVWLQPIDDLLRDAPALAAKHRHFEMFVLPFTGYAAGVIHEVYEGNDMLLPSSAEDTMLADLRRLRDWLGRFPALRTWAAQRFIDPQQTEEARERAHRLLSTVRSSRFNETEWHVPAENGIACLRQVIDAIHQHNEAFYPIEFRWVRGDGAWLSPFHGRDSCSIALHAAAGESYDYIVQIGARICQAHGGRPHWGKMHPLAAPALAPLYPRWRDFLALRQSFDPQGRMLNAHLRSLFGIT